MSEPIPKVATTSVPIAERFTLGELAAMAAMAATKTGAGGCPSCGCRDWRAAGRYAVGNQLLEKRACRNCGRALPGAPLRTGNAAQSASTAERDAADPLSDLL